MLESLPRPSTWNASGNGAGSQYFRQRRGEFCSPALRLFRRQSSEIVLNEKLFLFSPPFLNLDFPATGFGHSRMRLFENQLKISMGLCEESASLGVVDLDPFLGGNRNTDVQFIIGISDHVHEVHDYCCSPSTSLGTLDSLIIQRYLPYGWFTTSEPIAEARGESSGDEGNSAPPKFRARLQRRRNFSPAARVLENAKQFAFSRYPSIPLLI